MTGIIDRINPPHRRGVILTDDDQQLPFRFSDTCNCDAWQLQPGTRVTFCRCSDARDTLRAVCVQPLRSA